MKKHKLQVTRESQQQESERVALAKQQSTEALREQKDAAYREKLQQREERIAW